MTWSLSLSPWMKPIYWKKNSILTDVWDQWYKRFKETSRRSNSFQVYIAFKPFWLSVLIYTLVIYSRWRVLTIQPLKSKVSVGRQTAQTIVFAENPFGNCWVPPAVFRLLTGTSEMFLTAWIFLPLQGPVSIALCIPLRIISLLISARSLENGGFSFTARLRRRGKSSFLRKWINFSM